MECRGMQYPEGCETRSTGANLRESFRADGSRNHAGRYRNRASAIETKKV